jgi:hypothetical protein
MEMELAESSLNQIIKERLKNGVMVEKLDQKDF